ncbi:hypothetical protein Tco_1226464 [Tanacetum coccineum]
MYLDARFCGRSMEINHVNEFVKTLYAKMMRRCGGSSGGWSGGDGDDMVSVDGDSGGTRGGVEVARGVVDRVDRRRIYMFIDFCVRQSLAGKGGRRLTGGRRKNNGSGAK